MLWLLVVLVVLHRACTLQLVGLHPHPPLPPAHRPLYA